MFSNNAYEVEELANDNRIMHINGKYLKKYKPLLQEIKIVQDWFENIKDDINNLKPLMGKVQRCRSFKTLNASSVTQHSTSTTKSKKPGSWTKSCKRRGQGKMSFWRNATHCQTDSGCRP